MKTLFTIIALAFASVALRFLRLFNCFVSLLSQENKISFPARFPVRFPSFPVSSLGGKRGNEARFYAVECPNKSDSFGSRAREASNRTRARCQSIGSFFSPSAAGIAGHRGRAFPRVHDSGRSDKRAYIRFWDVFA